jgi:hypothetical protein
MLDGPTTLSRSLKGLRCRALASARISHASYTAKSALTRHHLKLGQDCSFWQHSMSAVAENLLSNVYSQYTHEADIYSGFDILPLFALLPPL